MKGVEEYGKINQKLEVKSSEKWKKESEVEIMKQNNNW